MRFPAALFPDRSVSVLAAILLCASAPPVPLVLAADGPPSPRADDFDWLQMKNGEWLKGEIKDLQDESLEFESDEFDTFSIDMEDVHALYSSKQNTVGLKDKTQIQGTLEIEAGAVKVTTASGVEEFRLEDLRAIVPGELSEWNFWSFKLSAGMTARRGNINQSDAQVKLFVSRRAPGTRSLFDYIGNFGTVEGEKTSNNHRINASHDIYMTERLYLRAFGIEVYADRFQNIDYRLSPVVGLGYDLVDTGKLEWNVTLGAGYQYTRFLTVEPGEDISKGSASLSLGTVYDWDATSKIDVIFRYNVVIPVPDTKDYNHSMLLTTEYEIMNNFDFDFTIGWDRINNPRAGEDNVVPLRDDFRFTFGISLDI